MAETKQAILRKIFWSAWFFMQSGQAVLCTMFREGTPRLGTWEWHLVIGELVTSTLFACLVVMVCVLFRKD